MTSTKKPIKKYKPSTVVRNSITFDVCNLLLSSAYILFTVGYLIWYATTFGRMDTDPNNEGLGWLWLLQTFGLPLIIPAMLVPIARLVILLLTIIGSVGYKKKKSFFNILKAAAGIRLSEIFLVFWVVQIVAGAAAYAVSGLPDYYAYVNNYTIPDSLYHIKDILAILLMIGIMLVYIIKGVIDFFVCIQGFRIKED